MSQLTDESPMPYGKYKGRAMANVPAAYLLWLYENGKSRWDVSKYVQENYDVLQSELKNSR